MAGSVSTLPVWWILEQNTIAAVPECPLRENQLVASERNLGVNQHECGAGSQGIQVLAQRGSKANWQCRSDCACTISLTRAVPGQMVPGTLEHSVICDSMKPDQLDNLEVYLMPLQLLDLEQII